MSKYLSVDAVLAIHDSVLAAHGGLAGVRERSLLESAVAAPQVTFGGEPIMTDDIEIAAAYLYYLCSNHAFLDGNKRTALASCLVYLSENKILQPKELNLIAWEELVLNVAASKLDRVETTERLRLLVANEN